MPVPHRKRPRTRGFVHVAQKLRDHLPNLRTPEAFGVLREAIRAGNERVGFRVVQFTVMSNHLHFFVEVQDETTLARGMQGLAIRIAKALNRHWRRRGSVFRERYFAKALQGLRSIRRALVYVLQNARKHGIRLPRGTPDPYSSAAWFRFWRERPSPPSTPSPVADHANPILDVILMRRIGLDEVPAGSKPTRSTWANPRCGFRKVWRPDSGKCGGLTEAA